MTQTPGFRFRAIAGLALGLTPSLVLSLALSLAFGLASPGRAQSLSAFEGRWQGTGELRLDEEPAQSFRCRLRLNPTGEAQMFFTGRCATTQAAINFQIMLIEGPGGRLRAENRAMGGSALPENFEGTAAPGHLELQAQDGAVFEMQLTEGTIIFRVEGHGRQGFARGQAVLARR